jgi:nucleoside-diphosphate-sugar epimerase
LSTAATKVKALTLPTPGIVSSRATRVQQGISLLSALVDSGVRRFIFSSSCTVYGEVKKIPIGEDSPLWPKNPYGWTIFTMERILETYDAAYGLKSVACAISMLPAPLNALARITIPKPI